ncbi:hypothetical protein DAQ1742_00792 [Dickeya aquatica]|uniref:Uncharacterized protein n=1 Tax=Dickeya aquatica TaxID=1401087 RepID=A0A375A8A8_9GAMM|nr:hypothetical protein DAQ1742_00792 [Dickeya aquatica]
MLRNEPHKKPIFYHGIIRLKTGIHQPQAIRLYLRHGYRVRGLFPRYDDDPLSVYMEKTLVDSA